MKVRISDIDWDTDGVPAEDLGLKKEIEADIPDEEGDLPDLVSDWLSDTFGYCVFGFSCERL